MKEKVNNKFTVSNEILWRKENAAELFWGIPTGCALSVEDPVGNEVGMPNEL